MSAAKVLSECLSVLKIIGTWVAAIKPDPRAVEPHPGMGCMDKTVGRILIGYMPPAALCQAILVLGGGAPFHPLTVLMFRVQTWGDVLPLNKIGKMHVISLRNRKLG